MKRLLVIILFVVNSSLYAQNIEVIPWFGRSYLFDFEEETPHFNSDYKTGLVYGGSIGVSDIKFSDMNLRLIFGFQRYSNELVVGSGGLGGHSTTELDVDKSVLTIGVYPFKRKLFDKFDFELGVEYSRLVREHYSGRDFGWLANEYWENQLDKDEKQYSAQKYWGLGMRIVYYHSLLERLNLLIQYSSVYGFSGEFVGLNTEVKSFKQAFGVGLSRAF